MRSIRTAFCLLGLATTFSSPAFAQSSAQDDRIQKLEKSLTTLEQQVYKSGSSKGKTTSSGTNDAQLDARMSEMEERLRLLNGKIEETEFSIRSLTEKLDKIIADIDVRVSTLERKASQPAPLPAAANKPETPEQNTGKEEKTEELSSAKESEKPDSKEAASEPKTKKTAQSDYDHAFNLLRQGKYEEAEKSLTQFITTHKESSLVGNAYYWLGETFYMRKNYEKAAVQFMKGYQQFPKASKAPDNLLKLGMSLTELKKPKEACTTFKKLTQEFSENGGSSLERAQKEMNKLSCAKDSKEGKETTEKETKESNKEKPSKAEGKHKKSTTKTKE